MRGGGPLLSRLLACRLASAVILRSPALPLPCDLVSLSTDIHPPAPFRATMKLSLERSFRIIWVAVGGLLLLGLLVVGVMVVVQLIGNAGAGDQAVRVARESTAPRANPHEARAVRYGVPRRIRGTETRLVLVGYGDGYQRMGIAPATSYGIHEEGGAQVNVIFLDGDEARLLVDRPAYLHGVSYPEAHLGSADSLQTWISYVMATEDGNGDGRLDERDPAGLYVTDLDGRGLRAVLPARLRYEAHELLGVGRILVYALEPPAGAAVAEERMPQRAFVYDVAAARLSPYAALDSAVTRAGQILAR